MDTCTHCLINILIPWFIIICICTRLGLIVTAAGPSTNLNPCSSTFVPSGNGFNAIDSTNHVTYVECLNYQVLHNYECDTGNYFDESNNQCVPGTWRDDSDLVFSNSNLCNSTYSGFVPIDSSLYAECFNYVEIERYSCPEGFSFKESIQQCIDNSNSASTSGNPSTNNTETAETSITSVMTKMCNTVSSGNIPLPSLEGWIVCKDGGALVTEYCGVSKLYNDDWGICVNYCENTISLNTKNTSTLARELILPHLAGRITCDVASETSLNSIICTAGTHFDVYLGYCRNFCDNSTQQYVSFPDQEGGLTCQNGEIISIQWCDTDSMYNPVRGVCMQTNSPTLSPSTVHPTLYPIPYPTEHPTVVPSGFPSISVTSNPSLSAQPSLDLFASEGEILMNLTDNAVSSLSCSVNMMNIAEFFGLIFGLGFL